MAKKGTGVAVAIGAAIAIGAVVAFASTKKKKTAGPDEGPDEDEEGLPEIGPPVAAPPPAALPPEQRPSPVVPTPTITTVDTPAITTPPFVPPDLFGPVEPTSAPPTPAAPPTVVTLPTDEDDEDEEPETAAAPAPPTSVELPGGIKVELPAPGTTVRLPAELGGAEIPIPTIPGLTAPETPAAVPAPIPAAVEVPSLVPADTAALAALMLADEATPNWKKTYPELGAWQATRGLKVDQKFGPGSATRMAQEIGTLPIIRFWPRGSTRETALEPYRNGILALAGTAPEPRRAQLILSANREQGQAFTAPNAPIKTLINLTETVAA